jgi:hypothetical protein
MAAHPRRALARTSGGRDIAALLRPEPGPAPTGPKPHLRHVELAVGLLALVVAGAVTGLVWELVAPLPEFQLAGERVLNPAVERETAVAADGWFAVVAAVAGILAAVLVFLRVRSTRISALAVLTVGGLLAAVVAWRVGVALGPDSVPEEAARVADGEFFNGPLRLSAVGVLFTWPLTSVITYFALAAGLDPDRPRRNGSHDPGAAREQRLPASFPPAGDRFNDIRGGWQ